MVLFGRGKKLEHSFSIIENQSMMILKQERKKGKNNEKNFQLLLKSYK